MDFNGTVYTYIHNLQGDIVGLLDNTGTLVVEYKYDAWGKLISTTGNLADTLGKRNPFRYRGYVYDEENGLYYLRSRYYNPTVGRFVNADECIGNIGTVLCHNVFSYCKNAPIVKYDPDGYFDLKSIDIVQYLMGKLLAKLFTGDKFGYTIMERWFNGFGKELSIENNEEWNQYLLANKNFVANIRVNAVGAIRDGTLKFDSEPGALSLDLVNNGEGDYCSGYGLINGTNIYYGGFKVSGTVQHVKNNCYHVTATYYLNDYVNPGSYVLDWVYAIGAWAVLGPCINYELHIRGTVEFDIYYG